MRCGWASMQGHPSTTFNRCDEIAAGANDMLGYVRFTTANQRNIDIKSKTEKRQPKGLRSTWMRAYDITAAGEDNGSLSIRSLVYLRAGLPTQRIHGQVAAHASKRIVQQWHGDA